MQWNRNLTPLNFFIMQWNSRRPTHLKTCITQWNPENWHLWKPTSHNETRKLTHLKTYITQCNLENWHIWKQLLYYGTPEAWCLWKKPASLNKTRLSKNEWKCTKRKISGLKLTCMSCHNNPVSDLTCHPPMFSNNLLIEIKKTNVKITSIYTMNGINKNQQTI